MEDIRSRERVKDHGEVFTPQWVVDEMLELIPEAAWQDPAYVFIEPTCGNGNFLVRILEKRIASGISVLDALNTIIGMDISDINIADSRKRMYDIALKHSKKDKKKMRAILVNNIFLVEDSLKVMDDYGKGVGVLAEKRFVYKDPTGYGQVMTPTQRAKAEANIEVKKNKKVKKNAA